ncbi:MAG: signal recognition particle-docking protein FtsY [Alphaproteobacteria bacterium]|nr:signal recognition particle-docking protein FtsY [Alphaproteobacteria bacterium]
MSWLKRLSQGLKRSAGRLGEGIAGIFTQRAVDAATLGELEELLIASDMGVAASGKLRAALAKRRFDQDAGGDAVREALAESIASLLAPCERVLAPDAAARPAVVLVCGVNGTGKTTTIGKLAARWRREGKRVTLAACDTFRAAAIEQLEVWGRRAEVPVVRGAVGGDAAGIAYEALTAARARGDDILAIDTAGRLQNKAVLMAELEKLPRVLAKLDPAAPHAVLLVLDATVGQNALSQVEVFLQTVKVSGLAMTKLDGTAKGGVLVALAERFGLPVHFIGVGEGIDDLQPFVARDFARALVGLEP